MEHIDERTEADLEAGTHTFLVVATDRFLSGWGAAKGGTAVAAWACSLADLPRVQAWVASRSDMQRVRVVHDPHGKFRPRKPCVHFHVYRVHARHPSLGAA